jgi:hypothetical protein
MSYGNHPPYSEILSLGLISLSIVGDRTLSLDTHFSAGPQLLISDNHDLHAGPNRQAATPFVMSYSGRVITGLEMRCATVLGTCSAAMGAEGDPPLALKKSINLGMEPNHAGQHVNYLEIYEPDVLAEENATRPPICSVVIQMTPDGASQRRAIRNRCTITLRRTN